MADIIFILIIRNGQNSESDGSKSRHDMTLMGAITDHEKNDDAVATQGGNQVIFRFGSLLFASGRSPFAFLVNTKKLRESLGLIQP